MDKQKVKNPSIRRVSIDKFYEIVTGKQNSFSELCRILPIVIRDVLKENKNQIIENNVIADLKNDGVENILQKLYIVTFKKYQGFEDFILNF